MYAVIDSGTSRSRLRVWADGGVVWSAERPVGARDSARHGPDQLRGSVAQLLQEARTHFPVHTVLASGMIGSPSGLAEVPHLRAPLSYGDLAGGLVTLDLPELGPVTFVPGVRTQPAGRDLTLADLAELDVMRGEEAEVYALRTQLGLRGPVGFVHYGSHHKVIRTDDTHILGSATTLGGELLSATLEHTLLAASTLAPGDLNAPQLQDALRSGSGDALWRAGLQEALRLGYARAAFSVRLADTLLGLGRTEATLYLLGAVAGLDLPMLPADLPLVLYGHATFTLPVGRHLQAGGHAVQVVPEEQGALAAAAGAVGLYERQRSPHV